MITWQLEELNLELLFSWKISRSSSDHKKNFLVKCELDDLVGMGEIAPNLRYSESETAILESFKNFTSESKDLGLDSLESLTQFFEESEYDYPNAFRFGIESAYLHLLSQVSEIPVSELVSGRTKQGLETMFSVPILDAVSVDDFYQEFSLDRFNILKLKIDNGAQSIDVIKRILNIHQGRVALDANEGFKTSKEVLTFLEQVNCDKIDFIEQPLVAQLSDDSKYLRQNSPVAIMGDEIITSGQVIDEYAESYHALNLKLMKAGSFIKLKRQLSQARSLGMKTMLGCMVESSIGISYAYALACDFDWLDLDGMLLVKNEPFKWLYEEGGKLYFQKH